MNILITGITGFIGREIALVAKENGMNITGQANGTKSDLSNISHCSIDKHTQWYRMLQGQYCVIHCAGISQLKDKHSLQAINTLKEVNTYGTLNLARQAAESGVKRFIFLSSVKVNGELTLPTRPFKSTELVSPPEHSVYGLSKYEAEIGLKKIAQETGMELVIIRSPLVYGPGVKANFQSILNMVYKRLPLPFGQITNKRSFVYINNLVDLVLTTINHPNAANKTFFVSDDDDVSVTELFNLVAKIMNRNIYLLPISQCWLEKVLRIMGLKSIAEKLTASLQVDISDTKKLLNWHPKYSFIDGLEITVKEFLNGKD